MKRLLFASSNPSKISEIRKILSDEYSILGLNDLSIEDEIPETGVTLTENALIKARYLYRKLPIDCFADDSGLEVDALEGAPGVYSARYSGEPKNEIRNITLLLKNMNGLKDRKAVFRTVIALILNGREFIFEGKIEGEIALKPSGENGFGYDPIFIPAGMNETFAEMSAEQKNVFSHRAIAIKKMKDFLQQNTMSIDL